MEGKAALFKRFSDIDAFPICLDAQDVDEIVAAVKVIAPVLASINLGDISAPRCFEVEVRLRVELDIPVVHDDQHGAAIVVLVALRNALRVVGKSLAEVKIVQSGAGAAGTAILRLLIKAGPRTSWSVTFIGWFTEPAKTPSVSTLRIWSGCPNALTRQGSPERSSRQLPVRMCLLESQCTICSPAMTSPR